jgi:hypothetical protein
MRLEEGRNEMSAVLDSPLGITTSFKLSTGPTPAWQAPRKISDFAQGIELQIGVKKSWITRKVQPEVVRLDDFYVSGFELGEDSAQIRLRKKPDLKDALVLRMWRQDTELFADVQRPEDDASEGLASPLDASDRAQVERLSQLLRAAAKEVVSHKERLLTVALDGTDVIEQDLVIAFVERLVHMFAPIVSEISRKSSNALELSLKREHDDGRREEVYLRKQELAKRVEPLSAPARSLFAPLGLTARPEAPPGHTPRPEQPVASSPRPEPPALTPRTPQPPTLTPRTPQPPASTPRPETSSVDITLEDDMDTVEGFRLDERGK